MDENKISL